jgi:hypothetical protein
MKRGITGESVKIRLVYPFWDNDNLYRRVSPVIAQRLFDRRFAVPLEALNSRGGIPPVRTAKNLSLSIANGGTVTEIMTRLNVSESVAKLIVISRPHVSRQLLIAKVPEIKGSKNNAKHRT